jgi:hypothetical protein
MGRPLNKKYFGNRNVGSLSTLADNKIGGEGIASINWSDYGSFRGNNGSFNPLVGLALPTPSIPTGVQATWTVLVEVESVTTGAGSVGLVNNDVYSYGTAPNFPECGNARWKVLSSTNNGTNATFQMTSYGTGINLSDLPGDTTTVTMTKVSGTGVNTFTVDINWRIRSTTAIVEQGSGYTGDETFTVTLYAGAVGTPPAGTIVLTTDTLDANGNQYASQSGDANRDAYEENAIIAVDVSDSSIVDIIKQENARRYKVQTSSTTKFLNLTYPTDSTGLYIQATDSHSNTYWVKKLNGHLATVVRNISGNGEFASNTAVRWTFDAPTNGQTVQIRNA